MSRRPTMRCLLRLGALPVDFDHQLVGLDHLGRLGESLADLREEGDVAVRDRLVVAGARCRRAARRGAPSPAPRARACARSFQPWAPPARAARPSRAGTQCGACRGDQAIHSRKVAAVPAPDKHARVPRLHAMSFDEFRARAARRPSRPRLARLPARHRHAGDGVRQAARGTVRLPARVARRPASETWSRYTFLGTAPARRVAAARRRRRGLDAGARLARRAHGRRPARRPERAPARASRRSTCPSSARSGAARSASSLRRRAPDRAAPDAAAARRRRARRAVRLHRRRRDHRQPARAGARRRRRAGGRRHERRRAAPRATTPRWRPIERTIARLRAPVRSPRSTSAGRAAGDGRVVVRARARSSPTSSGSRSTSSPATPSRCCSRGASSCRTTSPSTALYRALRALNPSPYMYHLVLDGVELVGSSPELLVRVDGGRGDRAARSPARGRAARTPERGRRAWRPSCSPTRRSAPST